MSNINKRPIYKLWLCIKSRCYNPNNVSYRNYGGRGIEMYSQWVNDYPLFESYIQSLGEKPEGYTLDRVNNNEGYQPMNLRWASRSEQQKNRRGCGKAGVPTNYKLGKTGYKWVTTHDSGLYLGRYRYHNKMIRVGYYSTPEEAFQAVLADRSKRGL